MFKYSLRIDLSQFKNILNFFGGIDLLKLKITQKSQLNR